MALNILLYPPHNIASFEAFAYNLFATDKGYDPKSGISTPFGKGIYSKYPDGSRYHDVTGVTSFSTRNVLVPVLQFDDNFSNKNALMFNLHSEKNRGEALDKVMDGYERGQRNVSAVTKIVQLVQDVDGIRPACLMMYPISPSEEPYKLVAFIAIIQNWDTVIGRAIPSNAKGIDFVLSDGTATFTFTISSDTTVKLLGKGDLHDRNYNSYQRTYYDFTNTGYAIYNIKYYPNETYFPAYLKIGPIVGCIVTMVFILLLSSLFAVYNYYLHRQLQHKQEALDSKRTFVRFISHEIRTPLNTVCLGLKLLQDEAHEALLLSKQTRVAVVEDDVEKCVNSENQKVNEEDNQNEYDTLINRNEQSTGSLSTVDHTLIKMEGVTNHSVSASRALTTSKPNNGVHAKEKKTLDGRVSGWVELIKDIEESSNNAVDVLNELMSYDKIEMKTLEIEKEILPIWTLLYSSIKPFYIQAREKGIQMELQLETESPIVSDERKRILRNLYVIGDPIRLVQVFRNLVSNALKFSDSGSIVKIDVTWVPDHMLTEGYSVLRSAIGSSLGKDPPAKQPMKGLSDLEPAGSVLISVEDSGPGLSADNMKLLFKEGVQFNANQLQAGGGSGLGLWITKGLVNLHNGKISAHSPGLGQGATFMVELPVLKHSVVTASQDISSEHLNDQDSEGTKILTEGPASLQLAVAKARSTTKVSIRNVLVVDDAMLNRKMVCRLLGNLGCSFTEATNGSEAVLTMKKVLDSNDPEQQFDLVFLDFEMPVMKGPEAAAEMRRLGCKTIIIGITGNVLQADVDYFMGHGADTVLSKPMSFLKLTDSMRHLNCSNLGDHIL
mmetsp:Transcript_14005/g.20931  ORF Transcript_14005/g.20931 Transcript_14005/m.20931 type:complete len:835 (+) Transcript_14005:315-2819(+)